VEQQLKWKLHNEEGWTLMWNDHAITAEVLRSMHRNQKINHFPGMSELSRKNRLARNLNLMRKELPEVLSSLP
jgi:tubulin polyglutamylase TTLL6/13